MSDPLDEWQRQNEWERKGKKQEERRNLLSIITNTKEEQMTKQKRYKSKNNITQQKYTSIILSFI